MRLLFFASSPFAIPTLAALAENHQLLAIITQPDRPAGRGGKLTPTPVAQHALANLPGIPLLRPENVNDPGVTSHLRALNADAWVVIAFGQKLGKPLLDGIFAINLHASLLPRWRGAAPIHAAILAGDRETGNSVITLADRMDAGLVLARSRTAIGPGDTTGDVHDRLAHEGVFLIEQVLAAFAAGRLEAQHQDESQVTMARKLDQADTKVRFSDPAETCRRRINAMSPRPGVSVQFRGDWVKLLRAVLAESEIADPGGSGSPIASFDCGAIVDSETGLVRCGDGLLRLLEVQPAGKRPQAWEEFARGRRIEAGERFIGA